MSSLESSLIIHPTNLAGADNIGVSSSSAEGLDPLESLLWDKILTSDSY